MEQGMFINTAIDSFDVLMPYNIYGLKKRIFSINNDLIKVKYNCNDIVNGPRWSSWGRFMEI